ncbi:MAG: putative blue pigment (indigoidine) exporter [Arcticibacterium sp.]|jgi:probable blue pigment (indigoidine) exporter
MSGQTKFYTFGIFFAMAWSSASVAAKVGLREVQPLVLYQWRFTVAAGCILLFIYSLLGKRFPKGKEWGQLALFGFINVTVSLGLFVLAIKEVAAGIGALQVGLNPLVISILTAIVAGRRIKTKEYVALFLGITGVAVCVYPLLLDSYATLKGLLLLSLSILSYSSAAVYYGNTHWDLDKLSINGWQAFFGSLFLLPITYLTYEPSQNLYGMDFTSSVLWLGIPVSVLGVFLWLWLLSEDTVRASYFLFLCPPFGLFYAYVFLDEPFTAYTFVGLMIVMLALFIGKLKG